MENNYTEYLDRLSERKVMFALVVKNDTGRRKVEGYTLSFALVTPETLNEMYAKADSLKSVKVQLFKKSAHDIVWAGDRGKFKVAQALRELNVDYQWIDTEAKWDEDKNNGQSKKNPTWLTVETELCKALNLRHTGQQYARFRKGYTPDGIDDTLRYGKQGHYIEVKGISGNIGTIR